LPLADTRPAHFINCAPIVSPPLAGIANLILGSYQIETLANKYTIEYIMKSTLPKSSRPPKKRIHSRFFSNVGGSEPVRDALLKLGRPTKTVVGEDIRFVELNWRVDRPYVDRLRSKKGEWEESLYEVRHRVRELEFRTLFFVYADAMILVHFFRKTTRRTPSMEIDLGWSRMKQWVREQKTLEMDMRKKGEP